MINIRINFYTNQIDERNTQQKEEVKIIVNNNNFKSLGCNITDSFYSQSINPESSIIQKINDSDNYEILANRFFFRNSIGEQNLDSFKENNVIQKNSVDMEKVKKKKIKVKFHDNKSIRCHFAGCSKSFSNKSNLTVHINNIHLNPSSDYFCNVCQIPLKYKKCNFKFVFFVNNFSFNSS